MYSRGGFTGEGRMHLQSAYKAIRVPTGRQKKEPFARYTQKGYKNRFTTCLLVPNVVEKKVFVIRKYRTVSSWYTISLLREPRPSV